MAQACRYEDQLRESARLVAEAVGVTDTALVYQSRSGPPQVPWLEPDILDHLRAVAARGVTDVVISPIGFVSDHLEVLFDLDVEAVETAAELGLNLVRAASAGTHPAFVAMIRELIEERLGLTAERRAVGRYAASHDTCPTDCCLPGHRPAEPLGRHAGVAGRRALARLFLDADAERQAPVLVALAVDRQPPLVATARLERQRARVDGERQLEGRAGLDPGWAPDLELDVVEEDDLPLFLLARRRPGTSPVDRLHRRARDAECAADSPDPMARGRGSRFRRASAPARSTTSRRRPR